jgi:hypothetical protein
MPCAWCCADPKPCPPRRRHSGPASIPRQLPAFYVPLMVMLFALIFRGIAFEYRFRAERRRAFWDWAFAAGSTLAAFCQGMTLGAFIDGIVPGQGALVFFSWFAAVSGLGLIAGYALLGAAWLILKTADSTGAFGRRAAHPALAATLAFIVLISLWTIPADFTVPGTDITVPGLPFWVALALSLVGTWLTHLIGKPLVQLEFRHERYEADFRFALGRLREYSEQVALLRGENAERRILGGPFGSCPGWVRSRAWIWLFSSIDNTTAWAGGST